MHSAALLTVFLSTTGSNGLNVAVPPSNANWERYKGEDLNLEKLSEQNAAGVDASVDVGGLTFINRGQNTTIVLNGEPKSGTTWLEFVAKEILVTACTYKRKCELTRYERTVSTRTMEELLTYSIDEKHTIPNVGHINKFDFTKAPVLSKDDLLVKARKTLDESEEGKKWLVIFRDPRDVAISSCYHMYKNCPNADGYVGGKIQTLATWIDTRFRFFKAVQELAPSRVMILFYEELKKDEGFYIKYLAKFFGLEVSRGQAKLIGERTTFSAMKDMPKKDMPQGGAASGKVREGNSCGYAKELSPEAAGRVTKTMRSALSAELNERWSC